MNIGEKIFELRKEKKLSQEEVAEKLNVTRQTVSKWETNQSTPDFDKIIPLCELFEISTDELLRGVKKDETENEKSETKKEEVTELLDDETKKVRRAKGISISIFIYFISVVWILISIPLLNINPILSTAIFLLICGIATYLIVYTNMIYKVKKTEEEIKVSNIEKQINEIIAIIILIIYLILSFSTMAWHITWILWLVYAIIEEIIKLVFMLRRNKNEE